MTATEGRLGIVVVNYRSHELIEQNLGALDLRDRPVTVVVVDNFSSAAERAAVTALCGARGWQLVSMPDNRGFGAGVNAGIRAARAAGCVCFLLLNPDARVDGALVEELRQHSLREPLALVAPRQVTSSGEIGFAGSQLLLGSGRIRGRHSTAAGGSGAAEEWLTGACLVVHDALLRRTGEFDESFFMYWEDLDFSHRCLDVGGTLVVRDDLQAVHDAGGTQQQDGSGKSALYYRYNCRNRLRFAARHLPRRRLLRWILATPAVSWEILLRGGRRQLLRRPGLLVAAVRGSGEGLASALLALLRGRPRRRRDGGPRILVAQPGAEMYGSDRMLAESVAGLVAAGCHVTVAVPFDGPLVERLRADGAEVAIVRMPVLRKSILRPAGFAGFIRDVGFGFPAAWRLIRRAGADGVYVNTVTLPLWLLLGRGMRRQVLLHVHEAERSASRPVRLLLALPALLAHRIVVNSSHTRDVLTESVPRLAGRTVVVLNGVAGPRSVVPPRELLEEPVRVVYVGRLSPRKGPQVAVEALDELVRRGVDARLTLAGSVFPGYEWFETELRARVEELGLADRVDVLGYVEDVWALYAAADVAVMPSLLEEGFGNTAVEAVLAARPVVVSDSSGMREAVAGYSCAQTVEPGDPMAWADALQHVVKEWTVYAAAATVDAREASRRHDPARYGGAIAQLIAADPHAMTG